MAKKILVIDDDPVGATLMEARLLKAGYGVLRAVNGLMGLEVAKREHPDLIILDVEMPEMNGYMFMGVLKKIEGFQTVPVIVLTSHAENRPIFQRKGVKHYLVKPINFDELLPKIAELLTQS